MTNLQIIVAEAIKLGLYTTEEIEALLASGHEIPLHTFAGWKQRGRIVRKGEHAKVTTRLWKFKRNAGNKPVQMEKDGEDDRNYYLCKSFLFTADQVEAI